MTRTIDTFGINRDCSAIGCGWQCELLKATHYWIKAKASVFGVPAVMKVLGIKGIKKEHLWEFILDHFPKDVHVGEVGDLLKILYNH